MQRDAGHGRRSLRYYRARGTDEADRVELQDKVYPISTIVQLQKTSELATGAQLRKRRLGRGMGYVTVSVLFKVDCLFEDIGGESLGLFENKRDKGGLWLMVHYTALSRTQPLLDVHHFPASRQVGVG